MDPHTFLELTQGVEVDAAYGGEFLLKWLTKKGLDWTWVRVWQKDGQVHKDLDAAQDAALTAFNAMLAERGSAARAARDHACWQSAMASLIAQGEARAEREPLFEALGGDYGGRDLTLRAAWLEAVRAFDAAVGARARTLLSVFREDAEVERYRASVAQRVREIRLNPLSTALPDDLEQDLQPSLLDLFVPPTLTRDGQPCDLDWLHQLTEAPSRRARLIVVEAPAGQGKTTLMKALALAFCDWRAARDAPSDAQRAELPGKAPLRGERDGLGVFLDRDSLCDADRLADVLERLPIPLFIDTEQLKTWDRSTSLQQLVKDKCRDVSLDAVLGLRRPICWLIDGYDEVDDDHQPALAAAIERLLETPHARVVVAARTLPDAVYVFGLSSVLLRLQPATDEMIGQMARRWFDFRARTGPTGRTVEADVEADVEAFRSRLAVWPNLGQMAESPQVAAMLIIAFPERLPVQDGPTSELSILDHAMRVRCRHHADRIKVSDRDIASVMHRVASMALYAISRGRSAERWPTGPSHAGIDTFYDRCGLGAHADSRRDAPHLPPKLMQRAIDYGLLLRVGGEDAIYRFPPLNLVEMLAALALSWCTPAGRDRLAEAFALHPRWRRLWALILTHTLACSADRRLGDAKPDAQPAIPLLGVPDDHERRVGHRAGLLIEALEAVPECPNDVRARIWTEHIAHIVAGFDDGYAEDESRPRCLLAPEDVLSWWRHFQEVDDADFGRLAARVYLSRGTITPDVDRVLGGTADSDAPSDPLVEVARRAMRDPWAVLRPVEGDVDRDPLLRTARRRFLDERRHHYIRAPWAAADRGPISEETLGWLIDRVVTDDAGDPRALAFHVLGRVAPHFVLTALTQHTPAGCDLSAPLAVIEDPKAPVALEAWLVDAIRSCPRRAAWLRRDADTWIRALATPAAEHRTAIATLLTPIAPEMLRGCIIGDDRRVALAAIDRLAEDMRGSADCPVDSLLLAARDSKADSVMRVRCLRALRRNLQPDQNLSAAVLNVVRTSLFDEDAEARQEASAYVDRVRFLMGTRVVTAENDDTVRGRVRGLWLATNEAIAGHGDWPALEELLDLMKIARMSKTPLAVRAVSQDIIERWFLLGPLPTNLGAQQWQREIALLLHSGSVQAFHAVVQRLTRLDVALDAWRSHIVHRIPGAEPDVRGSLYRLWCERALGPEASLLARARHDLLDDCPDRTRYWALKLIAGQAAPSDVDVALTWRGLRHRAALDPRDPGFEWLINRQARLIETGEVDWPSLAHVPRALLLPLAERVAELDENARRPHILAALCTPGDPRRAR